MVYIEIHYQINLAYRLKYSLLFSGQLDYSGTRVWLRVTFNNSIPETLYHFGSSLSIK
jgi:hypothetical protein